MITTDLFNEVLIKPTTLGANKLCVVSGYATSAMAFRHLKKLSDLKRSATVELMLGMPSFDGISLTNHKGFQSLVTTTFSGNFQCSYIYRPPAVHSKVYVWLKDDTPFRAFAGSANYTQKAFDTNQRESLVECDADEAFAYYDSLTPESIYCDHNDAELLVQIYNDKALQQIKASMESPEEAEIMETAGGIEVLGTLPRRTLSFLDKYGQLPQISGLNWGQGDTRKGRTGNEAYIKIPSTVYHTDFFPPRGVDFTVFTDDNKTMVCTRRQSEGKGISTSENNSLIGIYFRQRLGVKLGSAVQLNDLENYGRTDATFYKIDDETYFMDFSNGR